jgi:SAM-dependent methyltransferase
MTRQLFTRIKPILESLRLYQPVKRLVWRVGLAGPLLGLMSQERRARREIRDFLRRCEPWLGGFRGKRMLEIGSDGAGLLVRLLRDEFGAAEAVGANPAFPSREFGGGCRILSSDAASLAYPDAHFDSIVSMSAFEHVQNLEAVLRESHRLLRPGGRLFSSWGPIWTSCFGHHLWMEHGTYHNVLLAPWCHLLECEGQIVDVLLPRYGRKVAEAIAHYAFHSVEQNQKTYEDYLKILAACPLAVVWVNGYSDHVLGPRHLVGDVFDRYRRVRELRPELGELLYDGLEALLEKPGVPARRYTSSNTSIGRSPRRTSE